MNEVLQYVAGITSAANQGDVVALPLKVPAGRGFRVRYVEFRRSALGGADETLFVGLSRFNQLVLPTLVFTLMANHFIAFYSWGVEVVTSGSWGQSLSKKINVWDLNYVLVMPPTFVQRSVQQANTVDCVMAGELIPLTEGQRNAVIVWQGGVPKNG